MRQITAPRLKPVLELQLAELHRGAASTTEEMSPEQYWAESMAAAGIGHLEALHHWFVDLADVQDVETLAVILRAHLDAEDGFDPDDISQLEGGYVLMDGDERVIFPTCCCDFTDLQNWREATAGSSSWQMTWIGHPWIHSRIEDGRLLLSEPTENKEPVAAYSLSPEALAGAIEQAGALIEQFTAAVSAALSTLRVPCEPDKLARTIVGDCRG